MSVYDQASFAHPEAEYRPLQIVHAMDRFLTDPDDASFNWSSLTVDANNMVTLIWQ